MELERNRSNVGMEVEEARRGTAKPLQNVLGIRERRAESNNADGAANLARNVTHARADDLQNGL